MAATTIKISDHKYPPAPWSKNCLGDRRALAQSRDVPFSIIIDRQPFDGRLYGLFDNEDIRSILNVWNRYKPAEHLKIVFILYTRANKVLQHLSGGKFSFRLNEIGYSVNKDIDCSFDNYGFTMHVKHAFSFNHPLGGDIGTYSYDKGHFLVQPIGFFTSSVSRLTVGTIVHEVMHGLLGGHSYDKGGICDVFKPLLGLSPREANYLGWPHVPPTNILIDNPFTAAPSPL